MATKSILKEVTIRDKRLGFAFVEALENAQNKKSEPVQISRNCTELTGDKIKDFFGKR